MIINFNKDNNCYNVEFDRINVQNKPAHYGLYMYFWLLYESPNVTSHKLDNGYLINELNPIGHYGSSNDFVKHTIKENVSSWEMSFFAYGQKVRVTGTATSNIVNVYTSDITSEIKDILKHAEVSAQRDIKKISTVFISGSKSISYLDTNIVNHLNNIMSNKFDIIIGDCSGVDTLIQKYLHDANYPYVSIYYVGNTPRNNVGGWPAINVPVKNNELTPFEYYSKKDEEMAQKCDSGFVIWDMKSIGSKNNIVRLKQMNKLTIVYDNIVHQIKKY